jgi:hypothetical protein
VILKTYPNRSAEFIDLFMEGLRLTGDDLTTVDGLTLTVLVLDSYSLLVNVDWFRQINSKFLSVCTLEVICVFTIVIEVVFAFNDNVTFNGRKNVFVVNSSFDCSNRVVSNLVLGASSFLDYSAEFLGSF